MEPTEHHEPWHVAMCTGVVVTEEQHSPGCPDHEACPGC